MKYRIDVHTCIPCGRFIARNSLDFASASYAKIVLFVKRTTTYGLLMHADNTRFDRSKEIVCFFFASEHCGG
jgi:hypothetical protein